MFARPEKLHLPDRDTALPDRDRVIQPRGKHLVLGHSLLPPFPEGMSRVVLGMGCFWGAERLFWQEPGVYVTAVGYAGGLTANPSYEDVCSGATGHTEVVLVVFDEERVPLARILHLFWEEHDPTQGMRQGNDIGTQYRSAIYCSDDRQLALARESRERYQEALHRAGAGDITTEIARDVPFYYAEDYHQQYLARNPAGYCGLAGTGVSCPALPGAADPLMDA